MFGNSSWFALRSAGWGVTPISRWGWIYMAIWGAVVALPTLGFAVDFRFVEMGIWMLAAGGAFAGDVHSHVRQLRKAATPATANKAEPRRTKQPDGVLYIGDDSPELVTKNYRVNVR